MHPGQRTPTISAHKLPSSLGPLVARRLHEHGPCPLCAHDSSSHSASLSSVGVRSVFTASGVKFFLFLCAPAPQTSILKLGNHLLTVPFPLSAGCARGWQLPAAHHKAVSPTAGACPRRFRHLR
eukprot:scaffold26874_cov17-Tisochrysis_lutea.AAC.2